MHCFRTPPTPPPLGHDCAQTTSGRAEKSEQARLLFSGQIKSLDERQNVLLPLIKSARSLIYGCTNVCIRRTGSADWPRRRARRLLLPAGMCLTFYQPESTNTIEGVRFEDGLSVPELRLLYPRLGTRREAGAMGSGRPAPVTSFLFLLSPPPSPAPASLSPPLLARRLPAWSRKIRQWMPKDSRPRVLRGSLQHLVQRRSRVVVGKIQPFMKMNGTSTQLAPECDQTPLPGSKHGGCWRFQTPSLCCIDPVPPRPAFSPPHSYPVESTESTPRTSPAHTAGPQIASKKMAVARFLNQLLLWKQLWM